MRLRALTRLVADALAAIGAEPMFALPAGAPLPARATTLRPAVAPAGAAPGSSHERIEAAPDTAPDAGIPLDGSFDVPGETSMDGEHAETWQLVQRVQGGDGEAFGLIYDRYVDQVFRFIFYRVNDRALAEDFTSETFLRALRRIATISYQGRDLGAWLVTIARNIVFDHTKSARHRLETPTAESIESSEQERSTEATVLDTLQSERLMQAVDQLGTEQRECVLLRFIHGLSVSETAAVMNKNDGAVKALQHRAVRKLAELVAAELR